MYKSVSIRRFCSSVARTVNNNIYLHRNPHKVAKILILLIFFSTVSFYEVFGANNPVSVLVFLTVVFTGMRP
jgi:hypothetical protein